MKKYEVIIEETVSQAFIIEANDIEEADDIVRRKYKGGEIVLEPGELVNTQYKLSCEETDEDTNWLEM